jgi:hypothetical protein
VSARDRGVRGTVAVALALLLGVAWGHATLVFGIVTVAPDPPVAGRPFELTLTLEDPSLTPVEDAIVFVEFRPFDAAPVPSPSVEAPDLPPPLLSVRLVEGDPAVYQGEFVLPEAGTYQVLIRDQTFVWEEANASVVVAVDAEAVGRLPFILPPTQVAPRSLWTWLLWLVGVPLVAGAVVTVLVLTSSRGAPTGPASEGA